MENQNTPAVEKGISSFTLHVIASVLMLCDHMWATVIPGNDWLTWIGRIAFPIYAFMIIEGYFHTLNFKGYLKRLLIFAVISEIPFNLMTAGSLINPYHQNVLWTFIIVLLCVNAIENARKKNNTFLAVIASAGIILLSFLVSTLTMVDYFGFGVLTALVFYFFRGREWWQVLGQMIGLYFVNGALMGGLTSTITLFGCELEIVQQSMATLAMIPVLLYNGRQGPHSRAISLAFYAFYPVHMLILSVIWLWVI